MTKEETLKAAEVMRRWANGEVVEYKCSEGSDPWVPNPSPCWNWDKFDYRTVEAPKYRPWTADEVPVGAVVRRKSIPTLVCQISWKNDGRITLSNGEVWTPDGLFTAYERQDGSPCGVKI